MLPESFIFAIKAVSSGDGYLSRAAIGSMSRGGGREAPEWLAALTEKERQALRLLSQGYNNEEIAAEMHLGRQTVKNYVHEIYEKIGVRDRMQAMRLCIELKLFE